MYFDAPSSLHGHSATKEVGVFCPDGAAQRQRAGSNGPVVLIALSETCPGDLFKLRVGFRLDGLHNPKIASTKSTAASIFHRRRSAFFRGFGIALAIASRTMRRCTPSFFAMPAIVPTPNSYSRRICSKSSTLALQFNEPPARTKPNQSTRSLWRGPKYTAELGQFRIPKSRRAFECSPGFSEPRRHSAPAHESSAGSSASPADSRPGTRSHL
jgi:hypothetical protein